MRRGDWSYEPQVIATDFSADAVAAAIREIQHDKLTYAEFVRQTMAAGCVGYFIQISGRRAIHFGRNGDFHVEWFPNAAT